MSATEPVNVRVLDREYTVGVETEGRDALMSAARLLDARMREVRGANRMAAVDRVAVLAALNLAHELEQLRNEQGQRERDLARAVTELQRRLDAAAEAG
ncbi:cell division protein ZapA [Luteimonas sp. RD2P54]|uniref:Cell division protein ZapA n=1 Tax=Luteimonas endophytica TaxID=3042023 RepID=A0ABT6J8J5_9GAMM|nr:cell division protein ZapA [Luteimonas endophytica]MDH5822920.1 cell division protein ZapA [Luteimonas endophytica]